MKILITGITGVLGSRLAERFGEIAEIHGLKRATSSIELLKNPDQIIWHEGDVSNPISLEDALQGIDLVIHAAGLVSFEKKDQALLNKVNVEGTANLVNAMLEKDVKNLIHISSVAALGKNPDQYSINESQQWVDSELNTPYAVSKYLGDLEVWRGVQEGLNALVLHPSVVLTKVSDNRSSAQIYNYVLEENSYYPKGSINYIDVRDLVELTFRLHKQNIWNERIIINADSISYQSFFSKMASIFGKRSPDREVSTAMLRIALFFQGIAKLLRISKSPLNKQTAMMSQLTMVMDNTKLKSLISFEFTPLEETFVWAISNE